MLIRRGLPVIDEQIQGMLAEIQEKAGAVCRQSFGTPFEDLGKEVNKAGQHLSMIDDPLSLEKSLNNIVNSLFEICTKLPEANGETCELVKKADEESNIQNKINHIYVILSKIISIIQTPSKFHELAEKYKNEAKLQSGIKKINCITEASKYYSEASEQYWQQGIWIDSHITKALSNSIKVSVEGNDHKAIELLNKAIYEIDRAIKLINENDFEQLRKLQGIRFEYLAKKNIRLAIISNKKDDTILSDIIECFMNAAKMFEDLGGVNQEYNYVCKGCACLYQSLMHLNNGIKTKKIVWFWESFQSFKKSKEYYSTAESNLGIDLIEKISEITVLLKQFIYKHEKNIQSGNTIEIVQYDKIFHKIDDIFEEISSIGLKKLYISYILKEAMIEMDSIPKRKELKKSISFDKSKEIAKSQTEIEMKSSTQQFNAKQLEPTIGIITALPKEFTTMKILLVNSAYFKVPGQGAGRRYCLGKIPSNDGEYHSVVLALADMGNNIAALRASLLLEHFPNVTSIIMTGIAGGVPHPNKPDEHVRLGDIVVSDHRGVVQYDFISDKIIEKEYRFPPRPPSSSLLEAVRLLEASEIEGNRPWLKNIDFGVNKLKFHRPLEVKDILVSSGNPGEVIPHPHDQIRIDGQPRVFYGPIASANRLLKNPIKRDELREKFKIKAVEMESSGIADATWNREIGYLAIRGICDYCDSNKGDDWQGYAAIIAAAYTRALIESI